MIDCFGGPYRGRTYGPLIKSEAKGIAQGFDDWAIPPSYRHSSALGDLVVFVLI